MDRVGFRMMQSEFITKMIGKPWVNRASSFNSCDCWGLVLLYYKCVLNIGIPVFPGFINGVNFDECYKHEFPMWEEAKPESGMVFTAYKGEQPVHVGVCINKTHVLHSRGSVNNPGKVELHSIRAIEKMYGELTFYRFKNATTNN